MKRGIVGIGQRGIEGLRPSRKGRKNKPGKFTKEKRKTTLQG